MYNLQQFHDCSTIIGYGSLALCIHNQFVHAARTQSSAHCIHNRLAGIDVRHQLWLALRRVGAFLEEHNLRLLQW